MSYSAPRSAWKQLQTAKAGAYFSIMAIPLLSLGVTSCTPENADQSGERPTLPSLFSSTSQSQKPKSISSGQVCRDMLHFLNEVWPGTRGGTPHLKDEAAVNAYEFNDVLKRVQCDYNVSRPAFSGAASAPTERSSFDAVYRIDDFEISTETPPESSYRYVDVGGTEVLVGYGKSGWQNSATLIFEVKIDKWRGSMTLPTRSAWMTEQVTTQDELHGAATALVDVTRRAVDAIK